jgi:putative flippase GtrA
VLCKTSPGLEVATSNFASIVRASISSLAATAVDAAAYQACLFIWMGRYGVAAAVAAVGGAITNFVINRQWAFNAKDQNPLVQALRYAIVSLLTFLCLRGLLWLFIEMLGMGMRIAWLPAKILAFVMISYPLQRCWVFKARAV